MRKSKLSRSSRFGGTPNDMAIAPPRTVDNLPEPELQEVPPQMDPVIPTRRPRLRSREDMVQNDMALNEVKRRQGVEFTTGRTRGRANPLAPGASADTTTNPSGVNPSPDSALPR